MKHLLSPRLALALALSSAVIPVILIGCGGGGSSPLKTRPATTTFNTLFPLSNGQTARISGTRNADNSISNGRLIVSDGNSIGRTLSTGTQNAELGEDGVRIQVGVYTFIGTANPNGTFNIQGTFAVVGEATPRPFTLTGNLPTPTTPGTYSLDAGDISEDGDIPAPTPTAAPTSAPSTAPTSGPTATAAPTATSAPTATAAPTATTGPIATPTARPTSQPTPRFTPFPRPTPTPGFGGTNG